MRRPRRASRVNGGCRAGRKRRARASASTRGSCAGRRRPARRTPGARPRCVAARRKPPRAARAESVGDRVEATLLVAPTHLPDARAGDLEPPSQGFDHRRRGGQGEQARRALGDALLRATAVDEAGKTGRVGRRESDAVGQSVPHEGRSWPTSRLCLRTCRPVHARAGRARRRRGARRAYPAIPRSLRGTDRINRRRIVLGKRSREIGMPGGPSGRYDFHMSRSKRSE